MDCRLLPSLERVQVLRLSQQPPIPTGEACDGGGDGPCANEQLSAEEHRTWWGEQHGLWLNDERLAPFCTLRHADGHWSVVPAGTLWPAPAVRPIRRPPLLEAVADGALRGAARGRRHRDRRHGER